MYVSAVVIFLAAAALTAYYVETMAGGMPMPGGWTMSMMWMRMPGQGVVGAALMFGSMWLAMMVAMMLPSMLPMVALYRRAAAFAGTQNLAIDTWLLCGGYFLVWLAFGLVSYAIGVAISAWAMRSESVSLAVPLLSGTAMAAAGVYQLTPWKRICLRHCRDPLHLVARHLHGRRGALALGVHHGAFCTACCWALMVIQLMVGVMNVAAMVGVAALIAIEKLTPRGEAVARIAGLAAIGYGGLMLLRAV